MMPAHHLVIVLSNRGSEIGVRFRTAFLAIEGTSKGRSSTSSFIS